VVTTVTVNVVVPETVPDVAMMVVVPPATPVANPPDVIVATLVLDEAQVAVAVKSWVLPLL
jgi:hypothetical protein